MGLELARAYVTVRADSAGLGPDLQNAKNSVMAAMNDVAAGAVALLAPAALLGKGILSQGIGAAAWLEQTRIEMEVLLGSAEETQKTLDSLTRFAAETPFEMPQLVTVAKGLIQFGERGDEMMSTLKMLGDASGGTAEKFSILGRVLNDIRGAGRLIRQDFLQLSTRGIISLKDVAKYYKVTDQAADQMLSNGKIKFEDFRKILMGLTKEGGRFADMMKKQSTSFIGLKSTLNDSVNIMKRMLAEPLMPYLKGLYEVAIKAADGMSKLITQLGPGVSFAFAGATAFSGLSAALLGVSWAARLAGISLTKALIGTGVGVVIVALGAAIGYLVYSTDALSRTAEFLKSAWSGLVGLFQVSERTIQNLQVAWDRLSETFDIVSTRVSGVWERFSKIVEKPLHGVSKVFGDVFTNVLENTSEFVVQSAEWILALAKNWRGLWDAFPSMAAGALSYVFDIFSNLGQNILEVFKRTFRMIIDEFFKVAAGLEIGIRKLQASLGVRGKVTGAEQANILRSADIQGDKLKKMTGLGEDDEKFKGLLDMSNQTKGLFNSPAITRFFKNLMLTKKDIESLRGIENKGKPPTTPPPVPEKKDEISQLKAGMTEISSFGSKLQDTILNSADPALKTNSLLEESKGIQQRTLDAVKGLQNIGGLA